MKPLLPLFLSLFLCALPAFAQQAAVAPTASPAPSPASPAGITVLRDVEIGTGGGRPLHAEIAYPEKLPAQPMPAVIWIHGGGWSGGSHVQNNAEWLARYGYFTASIEYRLSGEAQWPAQIEDCKLGVRWLRANAAKYHVDPDRIAVWGASAGGHLVACLGTMGGLAQFEGGGGYPGVSSRVQAVVDFCGPVDFTQGSAGIQKLSAKPPDYESPGLHALFGGSFQDKKDLWKQGSPICHVSAGDPPFLVVHGDQDEIVPYAQAGEMVAALKKASVPVEFITVKGGGHSMKAAPGNPPAQPDIRALREAVLDFLNRNLKPRATGG
jgi:acetyl esterase/lipase